MAHDDVVRNVEWAVLTAQLPGCDAVSAGILLVDLASDELYVKLLPELTGGDEDVAEFWREHLGRSPKTSYSASSSSSAGQKAGIRTYPTSAFSAICTAALN